MLIGPDSARLFKTFLVYFYYALLLVSLYFLPREIGAWYYIPLALLISFYLADFISGMTHFILDYKKTPENIWLEELFRYEDKRSSDDYNEKKKLAFSKMSIMQRIVFNFKLHHPFPSKIGKQSYAHLCSVTIISAAIPLLILNLLLEQFYQSFALSLFLVALSFFSANSQYIHSLVHRKSEIPKPILLLMKRGILISKKKHAIHHATLDRDYCTINGYANSLVNKLSGWLVRKNYFSKDGLEPRG